MIRPLCRRARPRWAANSTSLSLNSVSRAVAGSCRM